MSRSTHNINREPLPPTEECQQKERGSELGYMFTDQSGSLNLAESGFTLRIASQLIKALRDKRNILFYLQQPFIIANAITGR